MPLNFPFFRFPYSHRYNNNYYPRYNNIKHHDIGSCNNNHCADDIHQISETNNENCNKNSITDNPSNTISDIFSFIPTSIGPLTFHVEALSDKEKPLFEMFGIKLYLDDVIIICLLIFLYQEQVDDQMLYIALFLLLF